MGEIYGCCDLLRATTSDNVFIGAADVTRKHKVRRAARSMLTVGTGSIWAAGKRQRDRLICPPDLSSRAKEDCCPLDCSKVMLVELPAVCLELALLACGLPAVGRSLLHGIDGCLDSLQSVECVRARGL